MGGMPGVGPALLLAFSPGSLAGLRAPRRASLAPRSASDYFTIRLGARPVRMQIAILPPELERGLMERKDLGPNDGMIFIFDVPQQLNFWMKDTPTPLDIGYLAPDGRLAEIYPLLPFDEQTVSSRNRQLQFALEMRQGWFSENSVRAGDRLDLKALSAAIQARGFDPKKFGLPRAQPLGISLSVFSSRTGVFVFTQSSASLKPLAGMFSKASPTVLTGWSRPFLVAL